MRLKAFTIYEKVINISQLRSKHLISMKSALPSQQTEELCAAKFGQIPSSRPDRGSSSGDVPALGSAGTGLSRAVLRKGADKRGFPGASTTGAGPPRHRAASAAPCSGERALPAQPTLRGGPAGEGRQPGLLSVQRARSHAVPALPARVLLQLFFTPSHSIYKSPRSPTPEPFLGQPHLTFRPLRGSPFPPSGQRQRRLPGPGGQPQSRASAPLV